MRILGRERLLAFCTLNFAAWIAYGLVSFAGALPYVGLVPHLNSVRSVLVSRAAFALIGLLSTSFLRSFFQHQRKRFASLLETAVWAFPFSYLAGLAGTAVANWARQAAGGQAVRGWRLSLEAPSAPSRCTFAGAPATLRSRPTGIWRPNSKMPYGPKPQPTKLS
jgi:hypothetical protein